MNRSSFSIVKKNSKQEGLNQMTFIPEFQTNLSLTRIFAGIEHQRITTQEYEAGHKIKMEKKTQTVTFTSSDATPTGWKYCQTVANVSKYRAALKFQVICNV